MGDLQEEPEVQGALGAEVLAPAWLGNHCHCCSSWSSRCCKGHHCQKMDSPRTQCPKMTSSMFQEGQGELVVLEVWVLEAWVLEASVPEASVPEAWVPEAWAPEAWAPEAWVPEAWVPEAWVPEAWESELELDLGEFHP